MEAAAAAEVSDSVVAAAAAVVVAWEDLGVRVLVLGVEGLSMVRIVGVYMGTVVDLEDKALASTMMNLHRRNGTSTTNMMNTTRA